VKFMGMGADGVQMGTRFLATVREQRIRCLQAGRRPMRTRTTSSSHQAPGSPCGNASSSSSRHPPMFQSALKQKRKPCCDKGMFFQGFKMETSLAARRQHDDGSSFCICNGLLSSAGIIRRRGAALYDGANGLPDRQDHDGQRTDGRTQRAACGDIVRRTVSQNRVPCP